MTLVVWVVWVVLFKVDVGLMLMVLSSSVSKCDVGLMWFSFEVGCCACLSNV